MSVNRQGVELFASYQLRTMEEDDCIVLLKSMYAYKGKKYKTTNHPEHPLLESLNGYYFNPEKIEYLRRNDANYDDEYLPTPEEEHGDIEDPTKEEQDAQREYEEEKADRAEELQEGKDADGNDIIEPASEIEKKPEKFQEKITSKNADAVENQDSDDDLDSVTGVAVEVWGEEANQFSSTSADNADEGFYSEQ